MGLQCYENAMTASAIRAGVIYILVFALVYLAETGLSNSFRVWAFIVIFAVCFVLVMKSVGDLLALAFCFLARYCGRELGRLVRITRSYSR